MSLLESTLQRGFKRDLRDLQVDNDAKDNELRRRNAMIQKLEDKVREHEKKLADQAVTLDAASTRRIKLMDTVEGQEREIADLRQTLGLQQSGSASGAAGSASNASPKGPGNRGFQPPEPAGPPPQKVARRGN